MHVHGEWLLTPYRLAVHQPTATAVIADVHLGYREARQQAGEAVPLLDMREQLAPLRLARERCRFDKLVVAGDLFERAVQDEPLVQWLDLLAEWNITWVGLVPGNHDRGWEAFTGRIPVFPEGTRLGDWHIIHGDTQVDSERSVLGHWHPVIRHAGRRRPCYLAAPRSLVLPAFSADAAGVPIGADPRWRGHTCFGIIGDRVVAM